MNILLCPDKFKGSLTAKEVCLTLKEGILTTNKDYNIFMHPMADGGDGSIEILKSKFDLQEVKVSTLDPLGRKIEASYYCADNTAFIELVSASGLVLLKNVERNPRFTSTFGTGLMIKDALKKGLNKIYLFIGGSATNDAGIGIAKALGFDFLDVNGNQLEPVGDNLGKIYKIQNNALFNFGDMEIIVLCDVNNPMTGPNGAAFTYAAQKGANPSDIQMLEDGLKNFSLIISNNLMQDLSNQYGMGAAGAVGVSLVGLLKANMKNGFKMISELTQLEEAITKANFIITGEGKIDSTSFQGKVVGNVLKLCEKHAKQCAVVAGDISRPDEPQNFNSAKIVYQKSIISLAKSVEDSMNSPKKYLHEIGVKIGKFLKK